MAGLSTNHEPRANAYDMVLLALSVPVDAPIWPIDCLSEVPFDKGLRLGNTNWTTIASLIHALSEECNNCARVDELLYELSCIVSPRGMLCEVSSLVVPFLCQIALFSTSESARLEILRFLVSLSMISSPSYYPSVQKRVSAASSLLVRSMNFCHLEPSVKNVSACFFTLIIPPEEDAERERLAAIFQPTMKSSHPNFRYLACLACDALLNRPIARAIDIEQLETELFDSAEEWESQKEERERLLTVCKAREFCRLPTEVHRNIRTFMYTPASV